MASGFIWKGNNLTFKAINCQGFNVLPLEAFTTLLTDEGHFFSSLKTYSVASLKEK